MQPDEQNSLYQAVALAEGYKAWLASACGQSVKTWMEHSWNSAINELIKEQENRVQKTGTDVLRGKLLMLQTFFEHVDAEIKKGDNAASRLRDSTS